MDVYNRVARPIVDNVLEGYNGTIFAYGQVSNCNQTMNSTLFKISLKLLNINEIMIQIQFCE